MSNDQARTGFGRRMVVGGALLLGLTGSVIGWFAPRGGNGQVVADDPALAGLPKLQVAREFPTPGPIASMIWSSDGAKLAAANLGIAAGIPFSTISLPNPFGKRITIWNADGQLLQTLQRPNFFFRADSTFAFVAGNRQIVAPAFDAGGLVVHVFDAETGDIAHEVAGPYPDGPQKKNWANLLLASPDQSVLAVAFGNDLPVILYSTRDWNKLAELSEVLQVSGLSPHALAFSNDGRFLAVAAGHAIVVYDLTIQRVAQRINAYPEPGGHVVIGAAFSPDGTKLAVAGHASREPVRIFNVSDGLLVAAYSEPVYETGDGLTWSRDGRFIAFMTGGRTRILHLWDPFRPEPSERTIELVSGPHSHAIALSAQAGKLAVDIDQNIRVFNLIR
jgi:hypothetical protein